MLQIICIKRWEDLSSGRGQPTNTIHVFLKELLNIKKGEIIWIIVYVDF